MDFLVAQLTQGAEDERDPMAPSVAALQGEHRRLDGLWTHAQQLRSALVAAEDLSLMALYEQQDAGPFLEDAHQQLHSLRALLPSVLLAMQPKRDEITLLLQEGEGRGLDRWLLPLLDDAPRRRWTLEGRPSVTSRSSERSREWGAPLTFEALRTAVANPERTFHEVLLSVRGPNAGVFLAFESGVHRFPPVVEKEGPFILVVRPVAMRDSLSEKELALAAIAPSAPLPIKQLRLMPAVREFLPEGGLALCDDARRLMLDPKDYFQSLELILLEHISLFEKAGGLDRESLFSFELDIVKGGKR
jgi:ATP-dependent Clp protease ATP-binding subunit ClpC